MSLNIHIMGQRIRGARKLRNMTAAALAEEIGIAVESLGHIECGVRKPSLQTLYNIAEILDVSLDYLVGRAASQSDVVIHAGVADGGLSAEQEKLLLNLSRSMIPVIKSQTIK